MRRWLAPGCLLGAALAWAALASPARGADPKRGAHAGPSASGAADAGTAGDAQADGGADDAQADGGADDGAAADSGDQDGGASVVSSCVERLPQGATRPDIVEDFPARGLSGYAAELVITVGHGKGETVLPEGFKIQRDSDAAHALEAAGFFLPEPDGGSPPSLSRTEKSEGATTKVTIPFLALPKDPGRVAMTLPPLPITVARASGELVTVCTAPHRILVEDPTSNESDPQVKPNPPPRPQREDWVFARQAAIGVLIGVALTILAGLLVRWWRKRPRAVYVPPPRPPWEIALEELGAVRVSTLLAEGKTDQYFDRVSDAVRKYLGARYGFDGLESTTDEMKSTLRRVRPSIAKFGDIVAFLEDCDLVKFARVIPSEDDCLAALDRGEEIVHATIPPRILADPAGKEAA